VSGQSVIILGLCLILSGLFSLYLGTGNDWDLRNYHLYGPFALLGGRLDLDLNAVGAQTTFNPLLDVPYYLLAVRWLPHAPRLVAFLAGLPFGVLVWLVFSLARLMPNGAAPWRAAVATAIGVTGTTVVSEVGQSFGDIPVAVLILAGLWFPLRCLGTAAAGTGAGWARACGTAGMLLGAAAGLKLTASVFAPGAALGLLLVGGAARWKIVGAVLFCLAWAAGALATDGWWGAHLWRDFGNPLFPVLNHLFGSAWGVASAGRDLRFPPRNALQAVFYPFWWLSNRPFIVSETCIRDAHFALAYLAVMFLGVRGLWRQVRNGEAPDRRVLLVVVFFAIGFVLWEAMFSIIRYAVPLEALTGIVILAAMRHLLPARRLVPSAALVLVALLATSSWPNWGRMRHYGHAVFDIEATSLPDGAIVVVASKPVGFVLPFLRGRDVAFLGAVDLPAGTRMQTAIRQRLDRAPGVVALVARSDPGTAVILAGVGLEADTAACVPVRTGRRPDDILLCPTRALDQDKP
jgi:hypothetical protein